MRAPLVALIAATAALAAPAPAHAMTGDPPPSAWVEPAPDPPGDDGQADPLTPSPTADLIVWRPSRAVGVWWNGRLERGVQLPAAGRDFFTWDPVYRDKPNRGWRRWGTDALIRTLLAVLRGYRVAHPEAPRVGIGDISRHHGGRFGREFGGLGHASHQIGLDVDVYYPRKDGLELRAAVPSQVDRDLAQSLVDRFRDAGAIRLFVGPSLHLRGPRRVVRPLIYHDDHVHVRLAKPPE